MYGCLSLGDDDVHLWEADLDARDLDSDQWTYLLSDDEMARAQRFHFERDERRFIRAHGMLRSLLGVYLKAKPSVLTFDYGSNQKPQLALPWAESGLSFNIAHSQQIGIFAFTRNREIGVDIECIRDIADMDGIAETNFHRNERASLQAMPPGERKAAFFRCWTRKEAFIKAIGQGLSHPLDQFDVSVAAGKPDRASVIDHGLGSKWEIWDVPIGSIGSAAVAVQGKGLKITIRRCTGCLPDRSWSREGFDESQGAA